MVRRWFAVLIVLAVAMPLASTTPAGAVVDLNFYYPVSVSGPLAKVMDGMVADFNRIHPGSHVTAIFVPQALAARDQLPYAQAELSTHNSAQIQKIFSDNLQAVLTGSKTPAQGLRDAQRQADEVLSQFRKK